jgi:hypothetical protein
MTNLTITPILPNSQGRKAIFVQIYKLFTITKLLALVTYVPVSLMRENLRGLRENLKHKILPLESTAGSEWEEDASSQRLTSISKEQLFQMLQKARGRYHKYKGRYSDLVKGYQVKTFVKPFVLPLP